MPPKKKFNPERRERRAELRQQRLGQTFNHVISLGSTCLLARHLQNKGLRMAKFPFDWMFSTPYLVRHALSDNFKTFLDPKQYSRTSTGGRNVGTHHKVYRLMQDTKGRKVLCPHHQLWSGAQTAKVDRDSYRRAVQRLRTVLTTTSRTLFVLLVTLRSTEALEAARDDSWSPTGRGKCPLPEHGGPELCSRAEILRLFKLLQEKCAGPFHFDVVYLVTPRAQATKHGSVRSRASCVLKKNGRKGRSLKISEVYCKGDNTGLVFQEEADMLAFHNILTECGYRRFALSQEDGSKKNGDAEAIKRPRERGAQESVKVDFKRPQSLKRRLQFVQKNPKVQGSSAHQRYEKYKKAKTLEEFLDLGAGFGGQKPSWHNGSLKSVTCKNARPISALD